jgi:5-methylcytosine-specific restriction endonuclease McrA
MPCHPARARKLLGKGKAAVYRQHPFTIILKDRADGVTQPIVLKIDPGSRGTGLALLKMQGDSFLLLWAANLLHRGLQIKNALEKRRTLRRGRRGRKTRYRQPRFSNRKRSIVDGWLPPSLMSRVYNVETWARRLMSYCPIAMIEVETVRFDIQKMENGDISGVEYQQGTLQGYEVREWLLVNRGRQCAYCGTTEAKFEVEHIVPKSRGGSNRLGNLTIACRDCNQKKGNRTPEEAGMPSQNLKTQSYRDAAAVNATRYKVGNVLKSFSLPVSFWSGGRTKFNRVKNGLPKDHWIDAACVGTSHSIVVPESLKPLEIKANGRGCRQLCLTDKYGFPRTKPKAGKQFFGFKTGDIVKADVPKGKNKGEYKGRVAVRQTGSFRVGKTDGINWKYCQITQMADGYEYSYIE